MSNISRQIWNQKMSAATAEAIEASRCLSEAVNAGLSHGRERIIAQIAREIGIPSSRVAKLIRLNIGRVWADEMTAIREWHMDWCHRQAAQNRHEAEILEARSSARRSP